MPKSDLPVIDLFAGAGGFGIAAKRSGCDLRLSVEIDPTACKTLRKNVTSSLHAVIEKDVRTLTGQELRHAANLAESDPLIVIGGPPCQPFSKASYWTDEGRDAAYRRAQRNGDSGVEKPAPITTAKPDDRRTLLEEFFRLVIESDADGFVMENVRSLLHPRNRDQFHALVGAFEDAGFRCSVADVEATSYGVPQKRQRIFILGSRAHEPRIPEPSHSVSGQGELPPPKPLGELLEPFRSSRYFEEGEVVKGKWAEQLREIPPGWNYKFLTSWANHPDPVFEAETRFWNFLLKLDPEKPSWTINANPGPWVGPFHWTSRRLRMPEMAAIQSFPVEYQFSGNRRDRVRQIGNAVPPDLAAVMIGSVAQTLSSQGA